MLLAAWQGRPAFPLPVDSRSPGNRHLPDGPGLLCGSAAARLDLPPGWEHIDVDWPAAFSHPGGPAAAADGPGWIVQTSGTGGAPRHVVIESPNISASVAASTAVLPFLPGHRWLLCLPADRIGGLMLVARALACSGALAMTEGFDADAIAASLVESRIGHLSVVPAMLEPLLDGIPPASLRSLLIGGSTLTLPLADRLRARSWPAWVSYGMTETCSHVTLAPVNDAWCPGLAGKPVPGARIETQGDRADPAPIAISGPMVMRGYLGEPPLDGTFLSADAGWMDAAGRLHVAGRTDDVIITGGTNVYPASVEAALTSMRGVDAAAVGSIPDPRWGRRLAALYVGDASPESLAETCRSRLSAAERPREFRRVAALPVNTSGKLDRPRVDELLASGRRTGAPEA
jgi:O-succinylbenzoic acid--CoA ligase